MGEAGLIPEGVEAGLSVGLGVVLGGGVEGVVVIDLHLIFIFNLRLVINIFI